MEGTAVAQLSKKELEETRIGFFQQKLHQLQSKQRESEEREEINDIIADT